jgi:hypothetical protein
MRVALVVSDELTEFNILAWREFQEHGIECQVFDDLSLIEAYNPTLIIQCKLNYAHKKEPSGLNQYGDKTWKFVPDISATGIETIYRNNEAFAKCLHYSLIKALTEPNPLYTEFRKDIRNPFNKPKDKGIHEGESVGVSPILYNAHNVKERDRFNRNILKCSRAIVHAVIEFMLLSKE